LSPRTCKPRPPGDRLFRSSHTPDTTSATATPGPPAGSLASNPSIIEVSATLHCVYCPACPISNYYSATPQAETCAVLSPPSLQKFLLLISLWKDLLNTKSSVHWLLLVTEKCFLKIDGVAKRLGKSKNRRSLPDCCKP
jgi:hypothetical protein